MYYVAEVNQSECAKYNCRQCVMFCPEPNTLIYQESKHVAWVNYVRCKGCAVCVYVCSDLLKRNCIQMVMMNAGG